MGTMSVECAAEWAVEWVEVPVPPDILVSLRPHVPRPLVPASVMGGPYRVSKRPLDIDDGHVGTQGGRRHHAPMDTILRRHMAVFVQVFVDCGWRRCSPDAGAGDVDVHLEHDAARKRVRLVWPWDWTDAPRTQAWTRGVASDRLLRPDGSVASAVMLPKSWRLAAMESFVHSTGPVRLYVSQTPRRLQNLHGTASFMDDLVSQVTDPERHSLFLSLRRRLGVTVHATTAEGRTSPPARFLCFAQMASSTKGGLVRYFVPTLEEVGMGAVGHGGTNHLRGFVGRHPDILHRCPPAHSAVNVESCEPLRPSRHISNEWELVDIVTGMSESDLCEELGVDTTAVVPMSAEALSDFGALASATRACWPFRQAFLRRLCVASGAAVRYVEVDIDADCDAVRTSTHVIVVSPPHGTFEQRPLLHSHQRHGACAGGGENGEHHGSGNRVVVWDGSRWGVHRGQK